MHRFSSPLTIIELMIIISIIGIVTVLAIPCYQDYQVRSRVVEGMTLANPAKLAIANNLASTGKLSVSSRTKFHAAANANGNVHDIKVASDGSGQITITYRPIAGGGTLTLVPTVLANKEIQWDCTGGSTLNQYRPANCRS